MPFGYLGTDLALLLAGADGGGEGFEWGRERKREKSSEGFTNRDVVGR